MITLETTVKKSICLLIRIHVQIIIVITVRARNFIKIFRVKIIRIGLD